jgi:hypothetical protein
LFAQIQERRNQEAMRGERGLAVTVRVGDGTRTWENTEEKED